MDNLANEVATGIAKTQIAKGAADKRAAKWKAAVGLGVRLLKAVRDSIVSVQIKRDALVITNVIHRPSLTHVIICI